jgi:hypothetical protein
MYDDTIEVHYYEAGYQLTIDGELWAEVEWSSSRKAWATLDAGGHWLTLAKHAQGAVRLAKRMIRDGRVPTPDQAEAVLRRHNAGPLGSLFGP